MGQLLYLLTFGLVGWTVSAIVLFIKNMRRPKEMRSVGRTVNFILAMSVWALIFILGYFVVPMINWILEMMK